MAYSVEWIAPTFALAGVVLGAFLKAVADAFGERRKERRRAVAQARLLADELRVSGHRIRAALTLGRWGPILDPGLPYGAGLWAVENRSGSPMPSVWPASREVLALLSPGEWEGISRPFLLIEGLSDLFWTNDPDRPLSEIEEARLNDILSATEAAIAVLDRQFGVR